MLLKPEPQKKTLGAHKTSLTSGIKLTADFDAEAICRIIETSAASRVTKITFNGVEVIFDGHPLHEPESSHTRKEMDKERKTEEENAILQDELTTREDQLAHMLVENPVEAERLIEQGLLRGLTNGDEEA